MLSRCPEMTLVRWFVVVGTVCALGAAYLMSMQPDAALTSASTPLVIAAFVCFWLANKEAKKARAASARRRW